MGNVALAEDLVSIDELEELFELDASESEPEDDEEDDDEEDDEDDEGSSLRKSRTADPAAGRVRMRNAPVRTRPRA